jgi:HlyD family secretion protein
MDRHGARIGSPLLLLLLAAACGGNATSDRVRASGYVEATDVRVAAEVGGRVVEVGVNEGDRVEAGALVARLDTTDIELTIARAAAERRQADAQLRLLVAGARPEDLRQAEAQVAAADAERRAAVAELEAATADLGRFERLLQSNAGSVKQRDDAAARKEIAAARVRAADERVRSAREGLARLRAGPRPQEIDAARARVAAADAQLAALRDDLADARILAPVAGVVTSRLVDPGELVAPRAPVAVITDLAHAWANVYVDEPIVPRLKLGQAAEVITDAGQRLPGRVSFISPKAEFTPRNVQTAAERSKLVYRIKITVDNRDGVLKPGMPVDAGIP